LTLERAEGGLLAIEPVIESLHAVQLGIVLEGLADARGPCRWPTSRVLFRLRQVPGLELGVALERGFGNSIGNSKGHFMIASGLLAGWRARRDSNPQPSDP